MKISLLVMLALLFGSFSPARAEEAKEEIKMDVAKAFFSKQLDAIKAGDVDAVKAGLSARLQDKVTKATLEKAKGQAAKMTVADLVDKLEGNKIKMKGGRTLTTMIKEKGKWVADTLWLK